MQGSLEISNFSLLLSTLLLVTAIFIAYKEELGLGKDILIAGVRAVIQLSIIGYILRYILEVDNNLITLLMVLFIIFNASYNAYKTSNGIKGSFKISVASIGIGTGIALAILLFSGALDWTPSQVVPITGMIASGAMTTIGVVYRSLMTQFRDNRQQILEKLALGADPKQASRTIVRESIQTGMTPYIQSTKTVGLVSLPGMMSGLIFAGIDPVEAIRYQIVVMFMMISVTSISSYIASYMTYRSFYNEHVQLDI